MKKTLTYGLILLIVTIITVSGTYAFFTATTTAEEPIAVESPQLEVIYMGDTEINGGLDLVRDKSGGHRREISIGLEENSVGAKANIFIYIKRTDFQRAL